MRKAIVAGVCVGLVCTLSSDPARAAPIYQCIENGQKVFSQKPCAPDAEPLLLPDDTAGLSANQELVERSRAATAEIFARQDRAAQRNQLIRTSQRRIADYQEKRAACNRDVDAYVYHPRLGYVKSNLAVRECIAGYDELIQRERLALDQRLADLRRTAEP